MCYIIFLVKYLIKYQLSFHHGWIVDTSSRHTFIAYPKDGPDGGRALRVSKILLTIYGIGFGVVGIYRENVAKKPFKIELQTEDLVSVYLDFTSNNVQFHRQRFPVVFVYKAKEGWAAMLAFTLPPTCNEVLPFTKKLEFSQKQTAKNPRVCTKIAVNLHRNMQLESCLVKCVHLHI